MFSNRPNSESFSPYLKVNMDFMTEPPPLPDLILSLEQATFMAKQLPSTSDQSQLLQIYTSLHHAHHHLSNFLSRMQFPTPPLPTAAENSLSSATGAAMDDNGHEPMQVGDDDEVEAEENSKATIEKVEEKMRECFIRNKRPKRRLSPSAAAAAEERRLSDDGFVGRGEDFSSALELVYQFHG